VSGRGNQRAHTHKHTHGEKEKITLNEFRYPNHLCICIIRRGETLQVLLAGKHNSHGLTY